MQDYGLKPDWSQLALPLMQAPMFIVSSLDLVIASCRAGVIGAFPSANPRLPETLDCRSFACSPMPLSSIPSRRGP